MTLLFGHDAAVSAWVAGRIPHLHDDDFGPGAAIGVMSGERLIAGVVFNFWQERFQTMQMSMAAVSPMWARPETIRALFRYPFVQVQVHKLWTITPVEYEKALKSLRHAGFKREALLSHHFGKGKHAYLSRMLRGEWWAKYGRQDHGRQHKD